jgi:hypothetical protein
MTDLTTSNELVKTWSFQGNNTSNLAILLPVFNWKNTNYELSDELQTRYQAELQKAKEMTQNTIEPIKIYERQTHASNLTEKELREMHEMTEQLYND